MPVTVHMGTGPETRMRMMMRMGHNKEEFTSGFLQRRRILRVEIDEELRGRRMCDTRRVGIITQLITRESQIGFSGRPRCTGSRDQNGDVEELDEDEDEDVCTRRHSAATTLLIMNERSAAGTASLHIRTGPLSSSSSLCDPATLRLCGSVSAALCARGMTPPSQPRLLLVIHRRRPCPLGS